MNAELEILYSKWRRAGYGLSAAAYHDPIDIEDLIMSTISECRNDPRLFTAVVSWLVEYADLVNIPRLIRMLKGRDTAAAGFVFTVALEYGADKRLKTLVAKCTGNKTPEVFFEVLKKWTVSSDREQKESLASADKWGFFCSDAEVRPELVYDRKTVLSQNSNMAVRALFGVSARSEILIYLMSHSKDYIRKIADKIGFSYQPVHKEVLSLQKNGMLSIESIGHIKMVSLAPGVRKHLSRAVFL